MDLVAEGRVTCPVLEEHLQVHRLSGKDADLDAETARLRRRYGLDADPNNACYEQQYERRLAAQVERGKLDPAEAEARAARMREELATGIDSDAVSGIVPCLVTALEFLHQPHGRGAGGA